MDITKLFGVIMTFSIPLAGIIGWIITEENEKRKQAEIRRLIIESNIDDNERIKLLIDKRTKKSSTYGSLRAGCILLGLGLGVAITYLCDMAKNDKFFITMAATGIGFGLIVSFIIEQKLEKKRKESERNAENE